MVFTDINFNNVPNVPKLPQFSTIFNKNNESKLIPIISI